MAFRRILTFILILALLCPMGAYAADFSTVTYCETDAQRVIRGYDREVGQLKNNKDGYTFMTFGRYPYTAEGDIMPVTWKVLAVEDGYAFCYSAYIIDFAQYHDKKIDLVNWKDNMIYTTLNETVRAKMFTDEELDAVLYSEERGWLFYLTNLQLRKEKYGFRHWQLDPQKPRECAPTPYAMTHPEAWVDEASGNTWYFSTGMPRVGFHNLIGFDGHTSTAANTRYGGVRCACYIDLSMLDNVQGSGTLEDPYSFDLIQDYNALSTDEDLTVVD